MNISKMRNLGLIIILNLVCLQLADCQYEIDWQFTFGGSNSDVGRHILENEDGSFIVGGQINSDDFDGETTSPNLSNLFLVKLDEFGNLIWKQFYDKGIGNEFIGSLKVCIDGGYLIGGTAFVQEEYNGELIESMDFWIIKVDSEGEIVWEKNFGGSSRDYIKDIMETQSGEILAVGGTRSFDGDISENFGESSGWLIKLSNDGEFLWEKSFGAGFNDVIREITISNTEEYFITGHRQIIESESIKNFSFLIKINEAGNIIWEKTFEGDSHFVETPRIIANPDGTIMLASSIETDILDIFLNQKTEDFKIMKLSDEGEVIWARTYGTTDHDEFIGFDYTEDGGYILGGTTGDITGPGIDNLPTVNVFLVKIDVDGELQWMQKIGGSKLDILFDITQTQDGAYAIAGYSNSIDGEKEICYGSLDAWFFKLQPETSGTTNSLFIESKVFPNPSKSYINFDEDINLKFENFSIFSNDGIKVRKGSFRDKQQNIFIGDLENGIYFLNLVSKDNTATYRFVKI